jgi:Fe-S oxidoreductase
MANALLQTPWLARMMRAAAGISPERALPRIASRPPGRRQRRTDHPVAVTLFADCFTSYLEPDVAAAATEVLSASEQPLNVAPPSLCCGLTWYSTGQLGIARAVLRRTVRRLATIGGGGPIVVLEPSCAGMLRDEAPVLLGREAEAVAARIVGLADVLDHSQYPALSLAGPLVTQVHCHEHAGAGSDAAQALTRQLVGEPHEIVTSCCGLAGNFGFEAGHEAVSRAVAEAGVLRALAAAGPDALVLADGFSCRTQVRELAPQPALHLAQLLRQSRAAAGAGEQSPTN